MRRAPALCALACMPTLAGAAAIDLGTTTCERYENVILNAESPSATADPINTVMWLLGFSIARTGDHVMYGDSLTAFGFALDNDCKSSPRKSLFDAVTAVKVKRDKPMDLKSLSCASFEKRHTDLVRTDRESADTLLMWLFGFSVGQSGGRVFDADGLRQFGSALDAQCAQHPDGSVFDALLAATPSNSPQRKPRR